ncbi:response regulator [Aurantiacibacter luteus]|uniref:Response regulatory domain-containing protein n=1 Tax=Aurantiacibacter luteus TaxID=1581420 RepID=A0A0G9MUT8_9SPHN|nr:response regulator [Aurantiacibacter luteus]KLE34502.1 hypothetical protein AAW00_09800 [Aurantiacibacter luteus]
MERGESLRVAIVEDDAIMTFLLREICAAAGHTGVGEAACAAGARRMFAECRPDVAFVDHALEGVEDGTQLLRAIGRDYPGMTTMLVTGYDIARLAALGGDPIADRLVQKPVRPRQLIALLDEVREQRRVAPAINPALARAA